MNTKILVAVIKDWLCKLVIAMATIFILNFIFGNIFGVLDELASEIGLAFSIIFPILVVLSDFIKKWRDSNDNFKPFVVATYDFYLTEVTDKALELLVVMVAILIGFLIFSDDIESKKLIGSVLFWGFVATSMAIALKAFGMTRQENAKI